MQDNDRNFDLQLRSMLEEAEIRPRRGVWKNISSRLDASAAVTSGSRAFSPGVLRWAGAAFACAAVALGVFLASPGTQTPLTLERGALTAEAVQLMPTEISAPAALGEGPARYSAAPVQSAAAVQAVQDSGSAEAEGSTMRQAPAADAEETARTPQTYRKAPAAGGTRETAASSEDSFSDPFALLAAEEERQNRNAFGSTFLYAKGSIGGNDPDFVRRAAGMAMAPGTSSSGISELSTSTYGIPLTLGLGVRFYLLPGFSIGTGVDYSLLTRTFTGTYTGPGASGKPEATEAGDIQHNMQYIGVPLDLYYDILSSDKIKFYVYGGGEVEYCVSNKYTVFTSPRITCSEPVRKLQYSVGGGVGVEFRLADKLGLYLDPGVKYYFPYGQPKSIRTDKPLMFNFDAGLRFSL